MAEPQRRRRLSRRGLAVSAIGLLLVAGGGIAAGVAVSSQHHAPQPTAAQAGTTGPVRSGPARGRSVPSTPSSTTPRLKKSTITTPTPPKRTVAQQGTGLFLAHSTPVAIDIPSIGVDSKLLTVGLNPDGTLQAPPLFELPSKAAWYKYSPTPGQAGPSVIEGHIDTYKGPSVFFRLGSLQPGQRVYVTLEDGTVAVFKVNGVRSYPKSSFPTVTIYRNIDYAGLRLLTCGGQFDSATGSYLSNTVAFASLISSHPVNKGIVTGSPTG